MVEIREEQNDSSQDEANDQSQRQRQGQPRPGQYPTIFEYMRNRSIDSILWALRLATIFFSLCYAFPFFGGPGAMSAYFTKALAAGAATNALRLHQRLGGFRFDRQFLATMLLEDSCHYLLYSIVFITSSSPVTMALLPVFLFAVLHWSNFTVQLLGATGHNDSWLCRMVRSVTEQYTAMLLSLIACVEIFVMPMLIILIFMGKASIFLPLIYYRFLTLRYMSQRNPNTRIAFTQLRQSIESTVHSPNCPAMIRSAAQWSIGMVCRLAPSA